MAKVWGILATTGFIACPCHLPATLPLLVGVLGGTSIGRFLSTNTGLVYGMATGYFILGLGVALFLFNRKHFWPKRHLRAISAPEWLRPAKGGQK